MADIARFGVAPSLLIYFWALKYLYQFGWAIAFIYLASVALRLAKFNTHTEDYLLLSTRYLNKLPRPVAAAAITGLVWLFNNISYANTDGWMCALAAILALYLSMVMVSSIYFRNFKEYDLKGKVVFTKTIFITFTITIMFIDPSMTLCCIFMVYALSGTLSAIHSKYCK